MDTFEQFEEWMESLTTPIVLTDELKQEIVEKAKELINW